MFVVGGKPGFLDLLSTTISGNGIETSGSGGIVEGGNLYAVDVTFRNTIVAGGAGPPATANCFVAATQSLGFNLDSVNQCGFTAAGDKVNTDPLLGPLQSNGGPTPTLLPAGNSPAVDQGSGTGLTDQRGVVRPIDFPSIPNSQTAGADGSDIGAVELQPSNAFKLGKLKKNKKKGTAKLTVTLPQPSAGTLVLSGKGLKKQTKAVTGQASIKLSVATKGGAAKSLRKKGKKKVKLEVSYTPTGNTAATKSRSTKLVRKHKKGNH